MSEKQKAKADGGPLRPPSGNIELCLTGTVGLNEFEQSIKAFVGLIKSVADRVSPGTDNSAWNVSVERGSMVIRATPKSVVLGAIEAAQETAYAIEQGLNRLESGSGENWPEMFKENALEFVRILARLTESENGVDLAEIGLNGITVPLSPRIARNARKLLKPRPRHSAIGNVEGKLGTISNRNDHQIVVVRSLDDTPVRCEFSDPELELNAKNLFGKRVSVIGIVEYTGKGIPTRVEASRITVFRPDNELIPLSEIRGVLQ